ncbi:MAG: hypothetical protein WA783_22080, partial [Phormidesmis sp.]
MSSPVLFLILAVAGVAFAQLGGFCLNQSAPVRDFEGKNALFVRMTGCLALLPVVIGVLVKDDSPEAMNFPEWMEVAAWVVIGAVGIQLLTDGRTLWRRGLQNQAAVPEV